MGVTVGIDSHKSSLAVAVLDDLGRPLGVREFANNSSEHQNLRRWIASHGDTRLIGVEGSGNFGAALTRHLLESGEDVLVPAFLSHRERKKAPARGKSDPQDALAIARVTARGDGLSAPQRTEIFQDLKLLSEHRDQLVRARTQLINRTHKNLVASHPGYEQRIPKLTTKRSLQTAMAMLRNDRSVRAGLIRDRIAEIRRINDKIAAVEKQLASKVIESGTGLTQLCGIGFIAAAKILGEVGDLRRLPMARRRGDLDTKLYMERQKAAGKSDKEAMRCLKRQLSNVVFRQLITEAKGLISTV